MTLPNHCIYTASDKCAGPDASMIACDFRLLTSKC